MEKKNYPTPHIKATPDDIAKTVLMPGDPLRAKFVAENFLENAVLFNNVRGIQGYTGTYKGKPVSVMASGMGMPSIGIYSYELFSFFGVENIIRIGSAGSMQKDVKVRDIVFGMGACTNSSYGEQYNLGGTFAPIADFALLRKSVEVAEKLGLSYHVGSLLSSDCFYNDDATVTEKWQKMGVLAVEMEAAALYMNASRLGKKALAICTISDSLVTGEALDSDARQNSFSDMMKVALEVAISF
ncbi:MAG: purine-nucleoside phosphorylase [Clostridia bacterium]|nr:purine-nucleoside phosphorylase [Clostridia bacterium]